LIEVLIFLSGERASFFYLNLSTIIIIVLSKNLKLQRLGILFISLLILILISFFNVDYKKRMIDNTFSQILLKNQDSLEKTNLKIFSTEHENHYKSALNMFLDNKLIGIGPRLFRKNCDKEKYKISFESCTTHPHNTYIQLLAETGILGFLVIFFVFVTLFYFCLKHFYLKLFYKKFIFSDFQISLISSIIITLWPIIPTANFFNNWVNVIYYLPVGILLWSFNKKF
jgi:O-antigen ligase